MARFYILESVTSHGQIHLHTTASRQSKTSTNSFTSSHYRPRLLAFLKPDICLHWMWVSRHKQIKPIIITDAVYTGYSIQMHIQYLTYTTHLSLLTTGKLEEWKNVCFDSFASLYRLQKDRSIGDGKWFILMPSRIVSEDYMFIRNILFCKWGTV